MKLSKQNSAARSKWQVQVLDTLGNIQGSVDTGLRGTKDATKSGNETAYLMLQTQGKQLIQLAGAIKQGFKLILIGIGLVLVAEVMHFFVK